MKRRRLPATEREIFRQAVKGVTPLRQNIHPPHHHHPPPAKLNHPPLPRSPSTDNLFSDAVEEGQLPTTSPLHYCGNGVQLRQFQRLSRGDLPIEDRLDLHGLRRDQARQEVSHFIQVSLQRQFRVVLIIHGKGSQTRQQQPLLKSLLSYWLQQLDQLLAYCPAQPKDGGDGAIYLLLRRPKR
ncbi:MAG: Smr/MutS family protein [Gammaproteobacteria bacterium]|nr:Smr/MutS family protein [Gammaproteobacteria bacterium]